jgi:plastocyanin
VARHAWRYWKEAAMRLPAILAIAGAVLVAPAATAQQAPVQMVALYSYGYAPNPIVFAAGRPVTLTFVNRSRNGHDFTARKFFANARILSGTVRNGEVGMGPGQSRSVTLIPRAGSYKVHCGHFLHKQLGMRADIVVR